MTTGRYVISLYRRLYYILYDIQEHACSLNVESKVTKVVLFTCTHALTPLTPPPPLSKIEKSRILIPSVWRAGETGFTFDVQVMTESGRFMVTVIMVSSVGDAGEICYMER